MKLVTYNLWNSPVRQPERLDAACEVLARVDADLVALQEVPAQLSATDERSAAEYLADRCRYPHHSMRLYPDDMEQQTLGGAGTPAWHDLARYHAEKTGSALRPTLDFWNNPRWHDALTLQIPVRCDWIMLQDLFERGLAWPQLLDTKLIGTEPAPRSGVVPSDHYGVYAELRF